MTLKETGKAGLKIACYFGSGMIVSQMIKATNPSERNSLSKLCVFLTGMVITDIISDKIVSKSSKSFDKVLNICKKISEE